MITSFATRMRARGAGAGFFGAGVRRYGMSSLFETLTQSLGANGLGQLGQQIGADPATTSTAVSTALPMLLGALARNAAQPNGAAAIQGALARDHDGSILDDVEGYLGAPNAGADGSGILGHLLGGQRSAVEAAVGQSAGLSSGSTARLLELLAPLVMGSLGRTASTQGLDASGLAGLLGQQHQDLHQSNPMLSGLMSLLDSNHDGSVVDDLTNAASRFFGKANA
jgi:hypothetical protein